ncbi:deoxyribodipyrimidine photolyase-related protein [Palleronia aestuarii]|uniref:Deoxyribodipyrimidine photolyase-related protein n=1 Tax=Palleronia aestuarii TaxID=568105 RepID=A0A2W7NET2_9RHOB|nr:cryptochrome/photolyase family protein [Palleronia aestuarii]PZX18430.1 deoxyribodipyrimidine photolyase-related protein [Palleronia aestuarii]
MSRLILVLGDQLTRNLSALEDLGAGDVVLMAEVMEEASYVPHHPKKIAFLFAAMRKFAAGLREEGVEVRYVTLDDSENSGSITGELLRAAEAYGTDEVIVTQPGEWRLIEALDDCPLRLTQRPDTRFVAKRSEFETWAEGRSELRMEWFYREMRKKTGLLMDGDDPAGGQWNFDHDNRKANPGEIAYGGPMQFTPDEITEDVLDLVEARFGDNFGDLRPFWFATDQGEARRALTRFVKEALPLFGDYQDAMLDEEAFLYHGIIGLYLNAGLLEPLEVCRAAEEAYRSGDAPINAVEGFIRQIIGWREFIRGIYFLQGPDYAQRNELGHGRSLPDFYWGAETKMRCISRTVAQTRENAYAHHIQRLMVTGNFALLAGIEPQQVQHWYMSVYADAYEWVMSANVIGMSQFADGGLMASKPYVSSGNYIAKMSDYCKGCAYDVKTKVGEGACPFNLLYWAFLDRHRERFERNPRMAQMYATFDRMDEEKREAVLSEAETFLNRMAQGALV